MLLVSFACLSTADTRGWRASATGVCCWCGYAHVRVCVAWWQTCQREGGRRSGWLAPLAHVAAASMSPGGWLRATAGLGRVVEPGATVASACCNGNQQEHHLTYVCVYVCARWCVCSERERRPAPATAPLWVPTPLSLPRRIPLHSIPLQRASLGTPVARASNPPPTYERTRVTVAVAPSQRRDAAPPCLRVQRSLCCAAAIGDEARRGEAR